jgi:hypothetical protein
MIRLPCNDIDLVTETSLLASEVNRYIDVPIGEPCMVEKMNDAHLSALELVVAC